MKILVAALSLIFIATSSHAGEKNNGISSLSPELQQLFSNEMVHLKQGLQEIMDSYITGKWDNIVPIAKKM